MPDNTTKRQADILFVRYLGVAFEMVERVAASRWRSECAPVASIDHNTNTVRVSLPGGVAERTFHFWISSTGEIVVWPVGSKPPVDIAADLLTADVDHREGASDADC